MAVDVNSALSKAYEELRSIDSDLSTLSGVTDRFNRKRPIGGGDTIAPSFSTGGRRVQDGGRKIIIGPETSGFPKRGRFEEGGGGGSHPAMPPPSSRDYSPPPLPSSASRSHRTLQSSVVVMPNIETKSRAAMINEMKKNEKKEDQVRNRRLFGNLLLGTLRQFQKDEKTVGSKGQTQIEKQREVERRLEETEKENRERMLREREALMARRREKELEIQALRRQKAIEQSAEEKTKHFRRLQCFIQTQTKPPLFFLPAKHTLRTLELLKESSRKIETLIVVRREEMDRELRRLEAFSAGGGIGGLAPAEDQEEEGHRGVKSAVVVKTEGGGEAEEEEEEESAMKEGDEEEGGKNEGAEEGEQRLNNGSGNQNGGGGSDEAQGEEVAEQGAGEGVEEDEEETEKNNADGDNEEEE